MVLVLPQRLRPPAAAWHPAWFIYIYGLVGSRAAAPTRSRTAALPQVLAAQSQARRRRCAAGTPVRQCLGGPGGRPPAASQPRSTHCPVPTPSGSILPSARRAGRARWQLRPGDAWARGCRCVRSPRRMVTRTAGRERVGGATGEIDGQSVSSAHSGARSAEPLAWLDAADICRLARAPSAACPELLGLRASERESERSPSWGSSEPSPIPHTRRAKRSRT